MPRYLFTLFFFLIIFSTNAQEQEAKLLRFPHLHNNTLVFTSAGDLYTVSTEGGIARKLTDDVGYEMFAKFSPDGKHIAFTGQYDGNSEVYIMTIDGNNLTRLTYSTSVNRDDVSDRMGPNNIVIGWTPDSKKIIFRARNNAYNPFKGQLFTIDRTGGVPYPIPISDGGFCSYSPDGKQLAFNWVFREFRTWKYYKGGMADDIWLYDFDSKKAKKILKNNAQDIIPMWIKKDIFFLSDRDHTMNLFRYNLNDNKTYKVTNYDDFDIKYPSTDNKQIVFEKGGDIYISNKTNTEFNKINIAIHPDMYLPSLQEKDASKNIHSFAVSPKGNRMLFNARGDVFVIDVASGYTQNLTNTSGVHERNVKWAPDGKHIAYLSDLNGEFEIYIQKAEPGAKPQQVSYGADTYKYNFKWSPDGKKIAWSDKKLRLKYVNLDFGQIHTVDQSAVWDFSDFSWSPDGRWLAYSKMEETTLNRIYIYDTEQAKIHPVTEGKYTALAPEFSEDGLYLIFSSQRTFKPVYSKTEWNHAYYDMFSLFLITLDKKTPSPFLDTKQKRMHKVNKVNIDFENIYKRVIPIPTEGGIYTNIQSRGKRIYYNLKKQGKKGVVLKCFDLVAQKEIVLANVVGSISNEKSKLLYKEKKKYFLADIQAESLMNKQEIDISKMKLHVDLEQEWRQIFYESWRQMRDFFYDPDMNGVDWELKRNKYASLLPYVHHKADLNYIIGEMIAELSTSHAYIAGGDLPVLKKTKLGYLGASYIREKSGYYRIEKILDGASWNTKFRSPLQEIGLHVEEGNYIIAVNGVDCREFTNIYSAFQNTAGKTVELTINTKPKKKGSRTIWVKTIVNEAALYYYSRIQENARFVDEFTNGTVGYIHIPDMGVNGLNLFVQSFYPQLAKKGLIIDVRNNAGGNVSSQIIERLTRRGSYYNLPRNVKEPRTTPRQVHNGPKVLVTNGYTMSDGDLFSFQFRFNGIGSIIGTRTWGGVIGIRASLPFVDGTNMRKPEYGKYSIKGDKWIIEGHGVEPYIYVENNPADEFQGIDNQLLKATKIIYDFVLINPGVMTMPSYPTQNE